ncbi:MAG: tRNA preQ1(34) S-adenosylmethionine ribosyltransferase-isomerase QueA [Planctomycetes bacterium]|nr:tRNA preQ1(34) S-adenosylmethionine ribosyltransferase-isomerase QueA [Planctomycetota bacterium]MCB9885512.1 tRNA preQ1(34) S-adenosylmethionine ribosyltransferase-isomerase QueA [Planctomycetota bacterium]
MLVTDFDFELPDELIAKAPAEPRDSSRLLHLDRATGAVSHHRFTDLPGFLRSGDLLVLNDTRVRPWRLRGRRASGGAVECLLLAVDGEVAEGFVKPSKKLRPGDVVPMEEGALELTLLESLGGGRWRLQLRAMDGDVAATLERCGRAPLPPYITRDGHEDVQQDRERYQTVFARAEGAVAAPTAGLHFTPELLAKIAALGVQTAFVTLHVGEGTFAPLRTDVVEEHRMHEERYELPDATATAVRLARERGGRVIAVGTTAARTLESCATDERRVVAGSGSTALFLYPGRPLRVVDVLLTNFHLPQSTLLMLVSAFAGREVVLAAYREAVRERYRFFSFGDAMLIA